MSSGGGGGGGDNEDDGNPLNPFKRLGVKVPIPSFEDFGNYFQDTQRSIVNNPVQGVGQLWTDWVKFSLQPIDEGLGSISGRNLMRDQQRQAEARLNDEITLRNKQQAAELRTRQQQDIAASSAADRSGAAARASRGVKTGSSVYQAPIGVERDFLGL